MKINYRKIASVIASAVMITSTVGFAAAANYPSPFSSGGAVVYGINAANTDMAAAIDVYANLKGSSTTSGSSSVSSSGGDSVNLATSSRKLYYADAINVARASLSNTEMSNVLGSSKFTDLSGTQYTYTQSIVPGPAAITFGTSGGDLTDPSIYIDAGNSGALTNGHLYNYTLSFSKNLNVSDPVNVQGQKIKILGVDYVIGSGSTNATLNLYGSGETANVIGGEESKITIAGTEHTVELITTSSATAGTLKVDGVSKSVVEGSSYAFAGNLNIYVKDIIHPAYAGDIRQAELILGSNTLVIQNGQSVKQGADQTNIKTTTAVVTASGQGFISGFLVAIAPSKSQTDSIKAGESFTDPVFGGLKVQFGGIIPDLADAGRDKIVVNTDNSQYAYVTFTSARAGDKGEQKLTFAYDNDTAAATVSTRLAHTTVATGNGRGKIHVLEGETLLQNDWVVVNQGDSGAILSVDDISLDTDSSATVTFSDVITGESQKITLTNNTGVYIKTGVNFFGGNGYTVNANYTGSTINITWSAANTRTIFPRIKLKGGGWIAFLQSTPVLNSTSLIFPNGLTTLSTTGDLGRNGTGFEGSNNQNGISWNWTSTDAGLVTGGVAGANATVINRIISPTCNFSSSPAILIIEPKKWNDASFGNYICVPMLGTTELSIARAVINGTNSGFASYTSDTYKSGAVDQYGTFITDEQRTNENGVATITYPASQMYADILFTAEATTITPGDGGLTGAVNIVKDTEISSVTDKNLIVIGGSCINAVAAKILESDTPLCGDQFTEKTKVGAGQYIIKTIASPYNADKVAMLVAGYNAADTENAASKLLTGVSSAIGEKIYPEVTTTA